MSFDSPQGNLRGSNSAGSTLLRDAERVRDALGISDREARSEVELLLMQALDITRAKLIAHLEIANEAKRNQTYQESLRRRLAGEPIAYIFGEREFYGHVLSVSPDVLIPRSETELLVDIALDRIEANAQSNVLDMGTGSGAIAIAIALHCPKVRVTAVDASQRALDVAAGNCARLLKSQYQIKLVLSDWFEQIDGTCFDLIVSNPPYIADGDMHLSQGDLRFEPETALVGGREGVAHLRRIISQAPQYLTHGGWLLFEHGFDQAAACRQLLDQAGFVELVCEQDLAGHFRVSGGRWLTQEPGTG